MSGLTELWILEIQGKMKIMTRKPRTGDEIQASLIMYFDLNSKEMQVWKDRGNHEPFDK